MRNQIIDAIHAKMAIDERVFFLTADMGINLVEKIQHSYPERFLNVGIAEQNLIGVSAGLANLGYRPFAYTICNFLVHRCFEQIRNDVCLHKYPITLVGTSTGYDNAPLGPTHHMVDDWGCLKSFPGIDIYCPSTVAYAMTLVDKVMSNGRPAYIRVPKGEFIGNEIQDDFAMVRCESRETLVVSYGELAQLCSEVGSANYQYSLMVMNRLHPLTDDSLRGLFQSYKRVIVIEDHFKETGIYSSLAMKFADWGFQGINLYSICPNKHRFDVKRQSKEYLHELFLELINILNS